jgi:hypothetical protein
MLAPLREVSNPIQEIDNKVLTGMEYEGEFRAVADMPNTEGVVRAPSVERPAVIKTVVIQLGEIRLKRRLAIL